MLYVSIIMLILMVYFAYDAAVIIGWLCQLGAWQLKQRRR